MSPVKSQGSSRCKGKAVASDSPAVPNVGEEMDRSDSEWSAEEETQRDPNSECAPLIDPWYEVNPRFLLRSKKGHNKIRPKTEEQVKPKRKKSRLSPKQ